MLCRFRDHFSDDLKYAILIYITVFAASLTVMFHCYCTPLIQYIKACYSKMLDSNIYPH